MITKEDLADIRGTVVRDTEGAKVGHVVDVYLDDTTGAPAWATVSTGVFGTSVRFVPMANAELAGRVLKVAVTREKVVACPHLAEDDHLGPLEEELLCAHYGLDYQGPEKAHEKPGDDDGLIKHVADLTAAAREAAARANPVGDGSFAGNADKQGWTGSSSLDGDDTADAPDDTAAEDRPTS